MPTINVLKLIFVLLDENKLHILRVTKISSLGKIFTVEARSYRSVLNFPIINNSLGCYNSPELSINTSKIIFALTAA
jgi:hypothetical protein